MTIENIRKQAEARYYSGAQLPQTMVDVTEFLRYIGVHPVQSVIDTHWKKMQRRQAVAAGSANAGIIPFSDVLAIATSCYNENAKVDPIVAEDQDYFAHAWALCGGGAESTGTVPAATLASVLADVGLPDEVLQVSQRKAFTQSSTKRRGSHAEGEQLTYKDFVEIATSSNALQQHSGGGEALKESAYGADTDDSYSRPRLSLRMMMRVKKVIRNFKKRRDERLERERRELELDAYARRYFGTTLFSPEGLSAAEVLNGRSASPDSSQVKNDRGGGGGGGTEDGGALTTETSVRVTTGAGKSFRLPPSSQQGRSAAASEPAARATATATPAQQQRASPAPSKQRAAGGALAAVRAARRPTGDGLPPLVDDSESAFDRALREHELEARRQAKERHEQNLRRLQKTHPHSHGVDVVRTYVKSPIPTPVRDRVLQRAQSPATCQTMGRPKPAPLSPTQLRQRR